MSATPASLTPADACAVNDSPERVDTPDGPTPIEGDPAQRSTEDEFFLPGDVRDGLEDTQVGLVSSDPPDL
eukprot:scaffold23499_cov31-Tisochrysis_lutea.AAC.1